MKFPYNVVTITDRFALVPHYCEGGHWFWLERYYRVRKPRHPGYVTYSYCYEHRSFVPWGGEGKKRVLHQLFCDKETADLRKTWKKGAEK